MAASDERSLVLHLCKALKSTLSQDNAKPKTVTALKGGNGSQAFSCVDDIMRYMRVFDLVCLVPDVSSTLMNSNSYCFCAGHRNN